MNRRKLNGSFLFALVFLFLCAVASSAKYDADRNLIPFCISEKCGYINNKGKIVIEPQFDEADRFSEGLARVEIGIKDGFIDARGKFVIEPIYRFAFNFSEGLAVVGKEFDSPWFYIDRTGKTIIEPPDYVWIGPFRNGLALFSTNIGGNTFDTYDLRYGFLDKSGKVLVPPKFAAAEDFVDGFAIVSEEKRKNPTSSYIDKKALINVRGEVVTGYFDNIEEFGEGLAAVELGDRWGFIDKTGNVRIAPQFEYVSRKFSEGIAFVSCDNDKIAAIDKTGKYVTECIFDETWGFSEGLCPVQIDGKFGYIDKKGSFEIKPQFDFAEPFYNGLAQIKIKSDGWIYLGFINRQGKFVFKPVKSEKIEEPYNESTENEQTAN